MLQMNEGLQKEQVVTLGDCVGRKEVHFPSWPWETWYKREKKNNFDSIWREAATSGDSSISVKTQTWREQSENRVII